MCQPVEEPERGLIEYLSDQLSVITLHLRNNKCYSFKLRLKYYLIGKQLSEKIKSSKTAVIASKKSK